MAASSLLHSVTLWENYLTAALTSTRAMGCPTMLVSYADWLEPAAAKAQLESLFSFLRCAHVQVCVRRRLCPTNRHTPGAQGLRHFLLPWLSSTPC